MGLNVILTGQSNMNGAASNDELPDNILTVPGNCRYYADEGRSDNVTYTDFTSQPDHGMDPYLLHLLSDHYNFVDMIKVSKGGQQINEWKKEGKLMYDSLLDSINNNGSFVPDASHDWVLVILQGEADRHDQTDALQWDGRFETGIANIRTALGVADMPVIVCKPGYVTTNPGYLSDLMNSMDTFVSNDSYAYSVDLSHTTPYLQSDGIHLKTQAHLDAAISVSNIIKSIYTG